MRDTVIDPGWQSGYLIAEVVLDSRMAGSEAIYTNTATRVIGLEVWENAFMFLKFGYATAAAWVLGAILIGFTMIQIGHLTKMKFSAVGSK